MARPVLTYTERKKRGDEARKRVMSGESRRQGEERPRAARPVLTYEAPKQKEVHYDVKETGGVSESAGARRMQERRMEQGNITVPRPIPVQAPTVNVSSNEALANRLKQVPVVGSILRGLDTFSNKIKPATDIAQELYTPGAGLGAIAAGERGAASLIGKIAPRLPSFVNRIGAESVVGGITGAGNSLAAHPEEGLTGAAKNAGIGTVFGAAAPVVGAGLKKVLSPLVSPLVEKIIAKYRPTEPVAASPTLGLPMGKPRGNVNGAVTPDVISPDYQFKLPFGDEHGRANHAAAAEDLQTINQEIHNMNTKYRIAVDNEFKYLKDTAKQGVEQGNIHFDNQGNVVGRTGRQSNNEKWYRDFYAANGRGPSNKEMYDLARHRVENGFQVDEAGNMAPSWLEQNDYHSTMEALTSVRDELNKSLNQMESKSVLTDATLKTNETSFNRPQSPVESPSAPKLATAEPVTAKNPKQAVETGTAAWQTQKRPTLTYTEPSRTMPRVQGIRSNFHTQDVSDAITPALKKRIAALDHTYTPITNAETVAAANAAIESKGIKNSVSDFLGRESTDAQHIAEGYRLMQILSAQGDDKGAAVVAAKVAADLTKAGQQAQAGRIIKRLSPEGQLIALTRKAEANGGEVSAEDAKAFKEAAKKEQAGATSGIRSNAIDDVIEKLSAGEAPTPEDLQVLSDLAKQGEDFAGKAKPKKAPKGKQFTKRDAVKAYAEQLEMDALGRIKGRKNQLNALPLGEWRDHAIVIAAQIAKGTIKAADHVEQIVKQFGEGSRPYATKLFEMANSIVKQAYPKVNGDDWTEANKIIKRLTETKQSDPVKLASKFNEQVKLTPEDANKIKSLAAQVKKAQGATGRDADIEMQKIMNKYAKSSYKDKITALRYMMMLGNTGTQLLNIGSGAIQAGLEVPMNLIGYMIESVLPKSERTIKVLGSNPLQFIGDLLQGVKTGAKAGYHGASPNGITNINEVGGLAFGKAPMLRQLEGGLGAVMKGADYGYYNALYNSELRKQASLAAKRNKLRGDEAGKFIKRFMNDPTPEAQQIADNVAKDVTFQRADKLGGRVAKWTGSAPKGVDTAVRTVMPFIKTPLNIAQQAAEMTPYGLVRGVWGLIKADSPAAQRDAVRTLSRGIGGGALSYLGYELSKAGIITGANQSGDKEVDAIREQAGKGKYRFNQSGAARFLSALVSGEGLEAARKAAKYQEGDRQFNYNRLQPLATPLAIGGTFNETGSAQAATGEGLQSLLGMSSVSTVQNLLSGQPNQTMGEKALNLPANILESYLKSFSPSLLAQEARRQDTTQRKTAYNQGILKDVGEYYQSRNPFGFGGKVPTSEDLPASKTTLGVDKKQAEGIAGQYANPFQSDITQYSKAAGIISDLIDRTGDKGVAPSAPEKYVKGKKVGSIEEIRIDIPPDRYAQLQEDIGQEVTQKILIIDPSATDEFKVKRIKKIMEDTRKKYMDRVKRELGIRVTS